MNARAKCVLTTLLVLMFSVSVALAPENTQAQGRYAFTQQELDQMLAPVALYPDALLSQILMASTYPLEIVEAARWSRANPELKGDQAVRAVERIDWDPSVKSLVAFPQLLTMMDENLDWTERLGDAFLNQQAQVMDTVQYLRQKAYAAGNLRSTDRLRVDLQGQTIVVELANPEIIYVPYYIPAVVYGTWWWPTHPPVYWAPWPGYYVRPGFVRGFAWGPGILVARGFFFGACDWHRRSVNIVNVNNYYYNPVYVHRQADITRNIHTTHSALNVWQHDQAHRRGVPYRDASLRQPLGRTSASPEARHDFRGHEPSAFEGRGGPGNRPVARGDPRSRPDERGSPQHIVGSLGTPPYTERAPSSSNVPAVASQLDLRSAPSHPHAPSAVGRPNSEQRLNAHDGAGHGADARNYSARAHPSHQAMAPGGSTVPAAQPSAKLSALKPSSSATAPQPADYPRGSSGIARRQQ